MSSDRRSGSRLPQDPAYWENLAARSIDAALRSSSVHAGGTRAGDARETRAGDARDETARFAVRAGAIRDPWWRGLSDAAFILAASAVLALFAGSVLLSERSPRAAPERALTHALAPDDPLLASLLDVPAGPPSASALLRLVALREEQR